MSTLSDLLTTTLTPCGFLRRDDVTLAATPTHTVWTRKTWNTNRGVILLAVDDTADPLGAIAQRNKIRWGKQLGYFPFFYGLGLQVVFEGAHLTDRAGDLQRSVDRFDNQRTILQSLHVLDHALNVRTSSRTWGQVITGKFQNVIERCLDDAIAGTRRP